MSTPAAAPRKHRRPKPKRRKPKPDKRTRRPHDALFKAAFETPAHAAGLFRSLLPAALASEIRWDTLEPQPGSFIDPALEDSHTDLLYAVQIGDAQGYLYLVLEHQSTQVFVMPRRLLEYILRVWTLHCKTHGTDHPLPVVIPVLICHVPGGWTAPTRLHDLVVPAPSSIPELSRFVPQVEVLIDDLTRLDEDELWARSLEVFPKLALWVLAHARNIPQLLEQLDRWVSAMRELLDAPNGVAAALQLFRYLILVGKDMRFADFREKLIDALPKSEEVMLTFAEQLRQEGLEQGLETGRQEGRQEGLRDALRQLLELKFGEQAEAWTDRFAAARSDELERYIARVISAESIATVFERH